MSELNEQLIPCPFCTADSGRVRVMDGYITVMCAKCDCEGPAKTTRPAAVAAWNRRTPAPQAAPSGLTETILEALKAYRLTNMLEADGDQGYPLIDALTPQGQTIDKGLAEAEMLADAIDSAIHAVTQAAPSEPVAQTDLAKRLLDMADKTGGRFAAISVLKADLIAICCEANRYYTGMMNWKATAEAKDATPLAAQQSPADARDGWKEAAIAWEVCASLHRQYAKGKDALFNTRQADYVKHAENARAAIAAATTSTEGR